MEFCGKPFKTLISSMSLELISLKTYMACKDSAPESHFRNKKKPHHYPLFPALSVLFLVLYSIMLNQRMASSFLPSFSYLRYSE
jgi:hypothetical protein